MPILELKYLSNYIRELKTENPPDHENLKSHLNSDNSNTNSTSSLDPTNLINNISDEEFYHKNNLSFLLLIMFAFFILSYYLHYVSKYNIKKAKSTNSENNIIYLKYSNVQNLSVANFSKYLFLFLFLYKK
jgi:hypothetical protein